MLDLEERDQITILRLAYGKVNALDIELLDAITKGPARERIEGLRQADDDASTRELT